MKKMQMAKCGLVAAAALFLTAASAAVAQGPYHVAAKWQPGGDSGWDYMGVDPVSHDLYITRRDQVMVLNSKTGKLIADMTGFKGTHGVVFDTDGKTGFITDGGANDVAVFDRKTFKVEETIPTEPGPDGVVFDPYTHSVWTFNGHSSSTTVIDARTKKVLANVALPGRPEFPVSDGKGNIYDNLESTSQIVRLNARTHKITAVWNLKPCESPSGLAIDIKHERLFSVCDNGMMAIVNAKTGKVIATPKIGGGPDAARFVANGQYAIASSGESGTMTIIHEDSPNHFTTVETLPTARSARTMAMMPDGSKLFTVAAKFGPRPKHGWPKMVPGTFEVLEITK